MSKNITIKEGAVARNFTGVKKLQTNVIGGGNQSWIPEDEAADYCTFKKITLRQNGTVKAEDNACDGFSEVTVDIASDLKEKIIRENGEYIAADDNCAGYSKVTVNVAGGGAGSEQHTVIFYAADRTTILEKATAEDGGGAIYHGVTPTASGMRFVGWSPAPVNVRADMNCYPRFENLSYDPTQILDDWITIAQKVRQNPDAYNIGQWKLLELAAFDADGTTIPACAIKMQLAGKNVDPLDGENGYAPTSWVMSNDSPQMGFFANVLARDTSTETVTWEYSQMRLLLQTTFSGQAFPQDLLNYVRKVIKPSVAWINGQVQTDYPTVDWFWQPSIHEILGGATDYNSFILGQQGNNRGELTGAVYDIFGKDDTVANLATYRQCVFQYLTRSVAWRPGVGRVEPWWINTDGSVNNQIATYSTQLRLGFCL